MGELFPVGVYIDDYYAPYRYRITRTDKNRFESRRSELLPIMKKICEEANLPVKITPVSLYGWGIEVDFKNDIEEAMFNYYASVSNLEIVNESET